MIFNGRSIRVAVGTQLMIDRDARSPYAAVRLMRRFFSGRQDLSFSDGANEEAEDLWCAAGGDVASMDSLTWVRVLRPVQYVAALLERRESLRPAIRALWPVCRAADVGLACNWLGRRYWLPELPDTAVDEDPSDETILWCIRHLAGERALQPQYEPDAFRWLLKRAGEKQMFGELRKGVVRTADGGILGWYLFYARQGGVAQVLQFGGKPQSIRRLLDHLFHQAWNLGAVGIAGKLEARFVRELVKSRCGFTWPGYGTLVQSKDREILNAIARGDAFLSRLEGEWWARFSDPGWTSGAPLRALPVEDIRHLAGAPPLNAG
jgi:hypothetical protein